MAMTEESMAIGVFQDHTVAEQAVHELRDAGFENDQIHLFGHSSGNFFDGIRNFFSGRNDATDVDANLASSGIAQEHMSFYQRKLEEGNFVVTVLAHGQQQEAQGILNRHGGYNDNASSNATTLNAASDEATAGTLAGAQTIDTETGVDETPTTTHDAIATSDGAQSISLREERLHADKQIVQSGEVIIRKRVITENKTFTIPVRREVVTIERRSLHDSSVTDSGSTNVSNEENFDTRADTDETIADMIDGGEMLSRDGNIRVLVREEQVTFSKKTVVIEEIVVSKKQVQEITPFTDTVKREEARVEHTGNVIIHDDDNA